MDSTGLPPEIAAWFDARGWAPRAHQTAMLAAAARGDHALLVADTGAGKTLAGFLPTLADFAPSRLNGNAPPEGLHTLYVSPLKALAHDVKRNLLTPVEHSVEICEAIHGAQMAVVPGAGHMLTMEQPARVNAVLLDWLATVGGR